MQVIPIYGRGGDNSDPRQMSISAKPEDQDSPVPNRPPGQRMAPVQVSGLQTLLGGIAAGFRGHRAPFWMNYGLACSQVICCLSVMAMSYRAEFALGLPLQRGTTSMLPGGLNPQQGIGIIPTLFGIHQGAITRTLMCLRATCSGCMHACMQHVLF